MVECKLCGATRKMARSHIIPRALYGTTLIHPLGPAKIISSARKSRAKRSSMGEYDSELLCLDCEALLSPYDDYAHTLFAKQAPDTRIEHEGAVIAYRYESVDFSLLRLFFISLVWRMHATRRAAFGSLDLGKYAEPFRTAILGRDSGALPEFDVVITRFDRADMGLLGPTRLRLEGVNGYRITFPGYSLWAKIDKRPVPNPFTEVMLSTGAPLHMLAMDFRDSAEFRAMLRLVSGPPT